MSALDLDQREQDVLNELLTKFRVADDYHKVCRKKWDHLSGLYHNYSEFRDSWARSSPNDRDEGLRDAQREWGAELFIPYAFSTVETILPRMLSHRPRMLVLPRKRNAEENVESMRALIDAQQEQISYELTLQDSIKTSLILGLGVEKTFWRESKRKRRKLKKRTLVGGWAEGKAESVTVFDDPDAIDVDPYDFLWDPLGTCMKTVGYVFHRTWRNTGYVLKQMEAGRWKNLDPEIVRGLGAGTKYDDLWERRMQMQGHTDFKASRDSQLHEVWEFHDGERVVTVLDRVAPVQLGENPAFHGEMPFHICRPTTSGVPKSFVGIGEIEPIEDLQHEMNTLRTQRRDNATLVLQKTFAYFAGMVDPDNLKFGPGMAIPVDGDPRDLLMPINVGDIPNSGYQEEGSLRSDIERTTGISEPVTGSAQGSAGSETATGAQLVHAAANERIKAKTRRCEVELIKNATRHFGELNQQKIVDNRTIRIPYEPQPGDEAERRWAWLEVGPEDLAGDMEYEPEGGSTQPENVPQERNDATIMWNMFGGNPNVNQEELLRTVLKKLGIVTPESWIVPPQQTIPMEAIPLIVQGLEEKGADRGQVQEIIDAAIAYATQQHDHPGQEPDQPAPAQNGDQPAVPAPV